MATSPTARAGAARRAHAASNCDRSLNGRVPRSDPPHTPDATDGFGALECVRHHERRWDPAAAPFAAETAGCERSREIAGREGTRSPREHAVRRIGAAAFPTYPQVYQFA